MKSPNKIGIIGQIKEAVSMGEVRVLLNELNSYKGVSNKTLNRAGRYADTRLKYLRLA